MNTQKEHHHPQTKKHSSNVVSSVSLLTIKQELVVTPVEVYTESAVRELKVSKPTKPPIKSGRTGQVHSAQA